MEREHEVSMPFEFLSKEEMADEHSMSPNLAPEKAL